MRQIVVGMAFGIVFSTVILAVWRGLRERRRTPGLAIILETIAIIAVFCVIALTEKYTSYHLTPIEWAQVIFGLVAGFVFRSWLGNAVRNLDSAPQRSNGYSEASKWWNSEPWRAVALISIIAIGAIVLPSLSFWINKVSRIKVSEVEIEIRRTVAVENKMNQERKLQKTSLENLNGLLAPDEMNSFLHRRLLTIIGLNPDWKPSRKKQAQRGDEAFLSLYRGMLYPVVKCATSLLDQQVSIEEVKAMTRDVAWKYHALLTSAAQVGVKRTESLVEPVRKLHATVSKHLQNADSGTCDLSLSQISGEEASRLPNSDWTYMVLSYLQYFNGDRLAAIGTLEQQRAKSPRNPSLYFLLGDFWSQEGWSSTETLSAFEEGKKLVLTAIDVTRDPQIKYLKDDKKKIDDRKTEHDRWEQALAFIQNSLAYELVISDLDNYRERLPQAVDLAAASIRLHFVQLAKEPGNDEISPTDLIDQTKQSRESDDFWAALDTYGIALLASASTDQTPSDDMICATKIFKTAKDRLDARLGDLVKGCRARDRNDDSAQPAGCKSFRTDYPRLDETYQLVSNHLRLSREILGDTPFPFECPWSKIWEKLQLKSSQKK